MTSPERRQLWGWGVAFFAGLAVFNTLLNSAYVSGMTLHDGTIFSTLFWRSGLDLHGPPVFYGTTFYNVHVSPILYVPSFASYFFPGDRITWYALVGGLAYFAMIYYAWRLLRAVTPWRHAPAIAALGAFLFFCGQAVTRGSWEIHMETISPLFVLIALEAWQNREYRRALLWLLVNAAIREDLGVTFAFPVAFLAGAQWLELRRRDPGLAREKIRWALILCAASVAWTAAAFAVQALFFDSVDLLHALYYDRSDPLGHLNFTLVIQRLWEILFRAPGLWLPLLVLTVVGAFWRDAQLLAGAAGIMPYVVINFCAKFWMTAVFESYKAFPFGVLMLWPSIVALSRPAPERRRYMILQFVILVCGLSYLNPMHTFVLANRWIAQPMAAQGESYRAFGAFLQGLGLQPPVRVSEGVLALYPYQFPGWREIGIQGMTETDAPGVQSILYFEGDRDQVRVNWLLVQGGYTVTPVPGTQIRVARRLPDTGEPLFGNGLDMKNNPPGGNKAD